VERHQCHGLSNRLPHSWRSCSFSVNTRRMAQTPKGRSLRQPAWSARRRGCILSADETVRFEYLPLSIRVETRGGVATPLVLRGTPLPATRAEVFSTAADSQVSVEVSLCLGESPLVRNNHKLGVFHLGGIPAAKSGEPQIRIEFKVDQTCTVTARARLEGSELSAEKVFPPGVSLSAEFIARALADAENTRREDEAQLRRTEAIDRAKILIRQAEARMADSPRADMNAAVAELGLALASSDADKIREKADRLEQMLSVASDLFSGDMFRPFFSTPPAAQKRTVSTAEPKSRPRPVVKRDLTVPRASHPLGRIFGGGAHTLDPQLCFVLMPFSEKLRPLYEDHVVPVVRKAGLRCERADEIRGISIITHDIWEYVNRARFLIAELTDRNPNVFYELGLAHAISKDVILLTQSMDSVPFDLKALRCICYDFTPRGVAQLEKALTATIEVLVKAG